MINLSRITLRNFKIFGGEPYVINFEDNNLVLLDGPNGYGKTSVFDAIELGLTGNINRLVILESRQNPSDVVVANKGARDVEITLEFKGQDSQIKIFQRKLKSVIPNSAKKISNFSELWNLYEIVNGQPVPAHQQSLDKYFDSRDFARDFRLFHYVQQEETSHFLKGNNEEKRAKELAQLFGETKDADERLSKLQEISKKIANTRKYVSAKTEHIKNHYKIDEKALVASVESATHSYVLPWLADSGRPVFWDAIGIPELNLEKLNSTLSEINNLRNLITHQRFFLRNRRFENAVQQQEILKLYVGYSNFLSEYPLYAESSAKCRKVEQSSAILRTGDFARIRENIKTDELFGVLGLDGSKSFDNALKILLEEEAKTSGLGSIYSLLINHHDAMHSGLQKLPDESECLLCGHDHGSHDALAKAISRHGQLLRSELSGNDKGLVEARDTFKSTHLTPLIQACAAYLEKVTAPSNEELMSLAKAVAAKDRFERLRSWLLSENVAHEDLLAKVFPVEGRDAYISTATEQMCHRIRSAIGDAPEGYYEANGASEFVRIYRDYFNNEQDKLALVSITQLNQKDEYIKFIYYSSLKETYFELVKLKKRGELLEHAATDVNELVSIVRAQIRQYRKKLITDIEIPFYIYSGKILQTHQAGLGHGIFIKDPMGEDELKNVRLVSNWESDHDILNTMSSGQISAVVIALTLALHKVYSTRFSSILIDDPVQTMDDINMSSLVEVLRNDFSEKQIILSTHEDKVARYFTYKYLKHSENVKIINLMQRKEYVPSNKFLYRASNSETE